MYFLSDSHLTQAPPVVPQVAYGGTKVPTLGAREALYSHLGARVSCGWIHRHQVSKFNIAPFLFRSFPPWNPCPESPDEFRPLGQLYLR